MVWQTRRRRLDLSVRGIIMGVVNVTPDSFSDGGRFPAADAAIAHGRQLLAEGAGILDIGGESTRPGAEPVAAAEQMRRVLPVIHGLRAAGDALISIDTSDAEVAAAAISAGADIINDVTGLRGDPGMARVAAATAAGVVVMHMQGAPRTMQLNPSYRDVVAEVRAFFIERLAFAQTAGLARDALVFDPGLGFGKTTEHNLTLLRHLDRLSPAPDRALVIGASRKSFLGRIVASDLTSARAWATVAVTSLARERGVRVVRVHEVRPNHQALEMTEAILGAGEQFETC